MSEDQKRLAIRNEMRIHNKFLAEAAKNAGVDTPKDLPTPNKSIKQIEKEEAKRISIDS